MAAYLTVDDEGDEWIFGDGLEKYHEFVKLPKCSIKKLIGRELKWEDNPVELEEDE